MSRIRGGVGPDDARGIGDYRLEDPDPPRSGHANSRQEMRRQVRHSLLASIRLIGRDEVDRLLKEIDAAAGR